MVKSGRLFVRGMKALRFTPMFTDTAIISAIIGTDSIRVYCGILEVGTIEEIMIDNTDKSEYLNNTKIEDG